MLFTSEVPKERFTLSLKLSTFSLSRTSLILVSAVLSVVSYTGFAQTAAPGNQQKNFTPEMDLSIGAFSQLTVARTPTISGNPLGNSYVFVQEKTQTSSPSAGVLGTFHQSFKPWLGYNVNVGYTRLSENYVSASGYISSSPATQSVGYSQGSIGTSVYELSLGYVVEGPRNKRFRTFGQVGGGGLFFQPTEKLPGRYQIRPAALFGVGMEYAVTPHFGIRAEYRGLFYKGPDFAYGPGPIPVVKLFTVTNEPTVSLVYRFGGTKKGYGSGTTH